MLIEVIQTAGGNSCGGVINEFTHVAGKSGLEIINTGVVAKMAGKPAPGKHTQHGRRPACQGRRLEATDHIQKFPVVGQSVDSSAGFFVRIRTDGIKFLHGSPVIISVCHNMS